MRCVPGVNYDAHAVNSDVNGNITIKSHDPNAEAWTFSAWQLTPAAAPEPSSLAVVLVGFGICFGGRNRRYSFIRTNRATAFSAASGSDRQLANQYVIIEL